MADVRLKTAGTSFAYAGTDYLKDAALSLLVNAGVNLTLQAANASATLIVNDLELALDGRAFTDSIRGIGVDMKYRFVEWPLDGLLALVPPSFAHYLDGITVTGGTLSSEGTVKGFYKSTSEGAEAAASEGSAGSMPVVDASIVLADASVNYPAMLPWPLTGVSADLTLHTDLSDEATRAQVNSLSARTPRSTLKAQGTLDKLLSDPHAALTADLSVDLADAKPFLPRTVPLAAAGKISGRVKADARLSHITRMQFDKVRLSGSLAISALDATYDTMAIATPVARLEFALPNAAPSTPAAKFASARLSADRLTARMGTGTEVSLTGTRLALETSDVRDTTKTPALGCDFAFTALAARMDDMSVAATEPSGRVSMEPGRRRAATQRCKVVLNSGLIDGKMADMSAMVARVGIDASLTYNESKSDIWQKLFPRGRISADDVVVSVPQLNYPVKVPALAMDFTPRRFNVERARVVLNESDFSLSGTVNNILQYARKESQLQAEFNFTSPVTNVSQLLALTSGIGSEQPEAENGGKAEVTPSGARGPNPDAVRLTQATAPAAPAPAIDEFTGPYMVPLGIDITLHADIKKMLWEGDPLFSNIKGDVQIKDGEMFISPELSFNSPITNGSIEFRYSTPHKNNLFARVALHLNDIEMQELVSKIPDLDELMPMLRGFNGQGEFHCAAEGYMDSTYRFKKSTLLGAGSIAATNLTLRDEELFRKIAFLLKYKEEGTIKVDSLRAEFSVFRDQIEIFPFLLKVDRYGAVISGNHNLKQEFNYNISLVESPLPFRVAVDVKGRPDDLSFKVFSKSRYPDFYRPKYNGVVENRQMELRNIIRDSLIQGRKDDEVEQEE
jgi:hypothetical protein